MIVQMDKLKLILVVAFTVFFEGINAQNTENEVSLLFIGDFMGHKDQIDAAYNSRTNTYDYNSCFEYIKETISDADFTIGNLEVTLGVKPYSGYPQFSSPEEYVVAIKNAGVDALVTATNHSCDKRKKGVERTISILDSLNIQHTGTFINQTVKNEIGPLIFEKNGIKLAVINYTYGTNGIPVTKPNVVNYLDKETIIKDIERAKLESPDEIIAFVHWGSEYQNLPSKYQKTWYEFFKKQGVNIVIGSHPHVLQPMVLDKEKNQLVVYSLGNFVSHQRTFPRDGSAVFKLNLIKEEGKVVIKDAKYKLTWVHEPIINGQKEYYVLPVSSFEKDTTGLLQKKDLDKMLRFSTHARKLLGEHNKNITEYK